MSRKKSAPSVEDPNALQITRRKGQDEASAMAESVLRPSIQATLTVREFGKIFGDLSVNALVEALQSQIDDTANGDLGRGEAMLTAQAHTLDAIFNNLARRAVNADYMSNMESYLKLALRAQAQCRATWEAIATIKNPPVAGYVAQANIAHGPQQVNNGSPRARETEKMPNELLEERHGERLDTRAKGAASSADPALAPVGEIDGAEDGQG